MACKHEMFSGILRTAGCTASNTSYSDAVCPSDSAIDLATEAGPLVPRAPVIHHQPIRRYHVTTAIFRLCRHRLGGSETLLATDRRRPSAPPTRRSFEPAGGD